MRGKESIGDKYLLSTEFCCCGWNFCKKETNFILWKIREKKKKKKKRKERKTTNKNCLSASPFQKSCNPVNEFCLKECEWKWCPSFPDMLLFLVQCPSISCFSLLCSGLIFCCLGKDWYDMISAITVVSTWRGLQFT